MANEFVTVRNTLTGQVGTYRRRIFENPRLMSPKVFEEVKEGTKPYAKKTYKPRKAKTVTPEPTQAEIKVSDDTETDTEKNEE